MHDFQMLHASEEAARFLHHACRGLPARVTAREESADEPGDFFYGRVLEDALAYFGSRVLYPSRTALRESDLRDLRERSREEVERETGLDFAEAIRALDFLLLHRLLETDVKQCERVRGSLDEGIRSSGTRFEYLTRQLAYLLGCDLYDGYLEGRVLPGFVRSLFLTHVEEPGTARDLYFALAHRLRSAKKKRPASVKKTASADQISQAN
jgi:hypothetical protein